MSPVVKRKPEKYQLPTKYWLCILSILCGVLMLVTFLFGGIGSFLADAAGFLVVPFEEGIAGIGSALSDRSAMLQDMESLVKENEELRKQVEELTAENISVQQDRFELINLRQLYQLDEEYSDYEKTGARIIAKDTGNWYHTFVINKGSDDGIEENMNVIAGGGLVGRVTTVGKNWAKVTAIINDNVSVSGMVLSTADNIIVNGSLQSYDEGFIEFGYLADDDNEVNVGAKIVTSGISDYYLPGILIGYISELNTDPNNLTKSGRITPAVDFGHLDEVLVILRQKQRAED